MTVILKSFPDLGRLFETSKVIDELYAIYPGDNAFLLILNRSIELKRPNAEVLATVLDHYYQAKEETLQTIGEKTMDKILKLLKNKP